MLGSFSGVTVPVHSKEGEAITKLDRKKAGRVPRLANRPAPQAGLPEVNTAALQPDSQWS